MGEADFMQWKMAQNGIFFFVAVILLASTGCRPNTASLDAAPAPRKGQRLTIACPSEAALQLIRVYATPWALRQGVALDICQYDPGNPKDEKGGKNLADAEVWVIPPAELPHWVAAGQLTPLPESYQSTNSSLAWHDLLPSLREQLLLWERKPYALPLAGESPLCCYRSDLLQAPAHRDALRKLFGRDLEGPNTWEQFVRLAEYFHEHGGDGRPAPSLPPLSKDDAELDRLFYTVAACYARRAVPAGEAHQAERENDLFAFHYDIDTGLPRLAAPGFVHALKLLQRMQACRPTEATEHPQEAFLSGRAVLCLTDSPWLKAFQRTPALRDKVGICPLPAGDHYYDFTSGKPQPKPEGNRVSYLGGAGWLAVVARSSAHPDTAFDLLAELAGPKTSTQIFLGAKDLGGPTRTDQLYRSRWDAFDLNETQEPRLREALQETLRCSNLKNPAICLRTPRQASHRTILVAALRKALREHADAEKTLKEVADAWKKLDEEQGKEAHLADYRRSVGLLAK
jgi:ABC-type glycerol-3-phosphate transport system substrate-binding protein